MKTILFFLLSFSTTNAVNIPSSELAEIRQRIVAMRAVIQEQSSELDAAKAAKGKLGESVGNLVLTNASQSSALIATQAAQVQAVQETARVQAAMDALALVIEKQKAEIAKQAAKLARWQKFGHAVLAFVFFAVALWAWQFLGKLFVAVPYGTAYRIAASLAVGAAASAALFYGIVHFL